MHETARAQHAKDGSKPLERVGGGFYNIERLRLGTTARWPLSARTNRVARAGARSGRSWACALGPA